MAPSNIQKLMSVIRPNRSLVVFPRRDQALALAKLVAKFCLRPSHVNAKSLDDCHEQKRSTHIVYGQLIVNFLRSTSC